MSVAARSRHGITIACAFAQAIALESRSFTRSRVARARGMRPERSVPVTEVDPLGPVALADPAAWYRSLHASGPVHYYPERDLWIINGYDEVRAALRAHDVLSSAEGITPYRMPVPMMVATDRPPHARLRRILARDFTRERMELLRPRIEELVGLMLAGIAAAPGGADAYETLAAPLPLRVIAQILGVPDADGEALRRWSDAAVRGFTLQPGLRGASILAGVLRDASEMFSYFARVIARRRVEPGDDALSRLVGYDDEQGLLSDDELLWFTLLLLVAGNETTTSLIMALLFCLGADRDQFDAIRDDPALIRPAVEEGLRWSSPIPSFFRTAIAPYEVAGATIPPRARVIVSYAAANRDPSRFPDPDRYDLHREIPDHVAFGFGTHFCLGAHLARLEASIVIESLLRDIERIELLGPPSWRRHPSLRGIEALRIRLHPVAAVVA